MVVLDIKGISKSFKDLKAVDDLSFSIDEGEIFGLLGPNGAGKSTTISMISSLNKPDEGDILYKKMSILKGSKTLEKELGMVPQDIALYPTLSGYDNLKFWGHVYGIRGKDLKLRIEETAELIGLSDRLKDRVDKYSGGMKRRLNIGVALIHKPRLLIMDEPTVGIDPQSRNHILNTVKMLNKEGMTIVYTSHYMEEVEELCNRICIMDRGKLLASGTKDELIKLVNGKEKIDVQFEALNDLVVEEIKKLSYIGEVSVLDNKVSIISEKAENLLGDLLQIIKTSNAKILSIDVQKPTLETVFLHLTGRALRD
ncbi:ABC transporter ATP-binding protein [Tissierella sp. Yu-01]|uniref:ABC transporter ATP-binding protein n=1 Tax=Tissierella sp. Yu-01 TaxID=3035694 RepID=UPI00240D183E|nr:ABC transporter ATP-binding protein [Tissierella sp. Yu-01]WFA08755.1 ABC transporter ATP-binding protein [Tissierella sp. Yu-01]